MQTWPPIHIVMCLLFIPSTRSGGWHNCKGPLKFEGAFVYLSIPLTRSCLSFERKNTLMWVVAYMSHVVLDMLKSLFQLDHQIDFSLFSLLKSSWCAISLIRLLTSPTLKPTSFHIICWSPQLHSIKMKKKYWDPMQSFTNTGNWTSWNTLHLEVCPIGTPVLSVP